jgi:hypothetical protein
MPHGGRLRANGEVGGVSPCALCLWPLLHMDGCHAQSRHLSPPTRRVRRLNPAKRTLCLVTGGACSRCAPPGRGEGLVVPDRNNLKCRRDTMPPRPTGDGRMAGDLAEASQAAPPPTGANNGASLPATGGGSWGRLLGLTRTVVAWRLGAVTSPKAGYRSGVRSGRLCWNSRRGGAI